MPWERSGGDDQGHYRRVPYTGVADPETQIRGLQALATFFGLRPAAVVRCRVLELGCAAGRNLLPQAAEFPGSEFTGLDAAADQVADGRAVAAEAGLANVDLRPARIEAVDASWGQFDYILCAGVFSWVPPEVRDQILRVCRENLAPDGIAVVTYNALPGWHLRAVARDLMRCHAAGIDDPREQIAAARAILQFAAEQGASGSVQGQVFRRERDYVRTVQDEYLYHDYLVDENSPLYFQDFMRRAQSHGLQLVCDADLAKQSGLFMPPAVQQVLANTPLVERCQLLDFLRNESFHKTLLCHREQQVDRSGRPGALRGFHIILIDVPQPAEFDDGTSAAVELTFPAGKLTIRDPLGKAAMHQLIRHRPQPVALEELHRLALGSLPESAATDDDRGETGLAKLEGAMTGALHAGLVKVFLDPPVYCPTVSPRPLAPPLVRVWAGRGIAGRKLGQAPPVVNQFHENIRLTDWEAFFLARLDGTATVETLVDTATRAVADGQLPSDEASGAVSDRTEHILADLANRALLIG